jgi:hypothetical protein
MAFTWRSNMKKETDVAWCCFSKYTQPDRFPGSLDSGFEDF